MRWKMPPRSLIFFCGAVSQIWVKEAVIDWGCHFLRGVLALHITPFLHHFNENTGEIPGPQLISTPPERCDIFIHHAASSRLAINVSHVAAHSTASQATPCTYGWNMLNKTSLSFQGIHLRAEVGSSVSEILLEYQIKLAYRLFTVKDVAIQ